MTCSSCPGGPSVGVCDVCGQLKDVKYCSICHAFLCDSCRANPIARAKAAVRRRFGQPVQQPFIF